MTYFNDDAALVYLELTMLSYDLEIFDKAVYLERFYDLQNYYRGEQSQELIDTINLMVLELEDNEARFIEYENEIEKNKTGSNESHLTKKPDNIAPLPHFITANKGKFYHWGFSENDHESFPSVPHGHGQGFYNIKLNPFNGFMYNGKSKLQREDKEYIVNLWNDPFFRSFAKNAMTVYMQRYATLPWQKRRSFFGRLITRQWFKFLNLASK